MGFLFERRNAKTGRHISLISSPTAIYKDGQKEKIWDVVMREGQRIQVHVMTSIHKCNVKHILHGFNEF